MYASNEDEYNQENDDWVFLRQTPPLNTVLQESVNLTDHQQIDSDSSSSSSDSSNSSSSSSKSDRSDSLSSILSTEHEQIQNNEQENHLINDNPVLNTHDLHDNNDLLSTSEIKEDILSSETIINQDDGNEATPVINEYDFSNEIIESSNNLRHRTGANVQETVEDYPLTAEHERSPSRMYYYYRPRRNKAVIAYGVLILLFALQLILSRYMSSQRLMINKLTDELEKTNKHLDEIQTISIADIEQKLTKQLEEKFQKLINQKTLEFDQEKFSLISQINELYHIINLTQQNLTNSIYQLSEENQHLQQQIISLEHRLEITKEQSSKENTSCPEGVDCEKSSLPSLDVLLGHLIKQTTSIAGDTSVNFSDLFEQLSASFNDFIDQGQEYVEESKRKLTDFANSPTAEQVQTTIRRSVENFSSKLRKAQSDYVTWLRTRAKEREQARTSNTEQVDEEEKPARRRPWRWTFQRSHDREQLRQQTPVTKKHTSNKDYVCHSKYDFPVKHICTMKNWMGKFFRP